MLSETSCAHTHCHIAHVRCVVIAFRFGTRTRVFHMFFSGPSHTKKTHIGMRSSLATWRCKLPHTTGTAMDKRYQHRVATGKAIVALQELSHTCVRTHPHATHTTHVTRNMQVWCNEDLHDSVEQRRSCRGCMCDGSWCSLSCQHLLGHLVLWSVSSFFLELIFFYRFTL